ncbi:MAG: Uma2 family endonuclease [Ferruginibacter sp.]|nr:Uma2 family endonuclease [Ferruginibacter sp.]
MELSDQIFKPERYTYQDYLLWKGDWELVNGYPYAMAPSPVRTHQWFSNKFMQKASNKIDEFASGCNCGAYAELDWIIDEHSIVRPDCMIVCGNFTEDFLTFPPTVIVEISSKKTQLRDRNTKYNLYELQGVKYYLISDTEKRSVEVFELLNGKYVPKNDTKFQLTPECIIEFDVFSLWQLM